MPHEAPDVLAAFEEHERELAIRRIRVGCILAMSLLPMGAIVDWLLFPPSRLPEFLGYRFLGSIMMLPFLILVRHPIGARHFRIIGVVLAMFPALAMAVIIFRSDGAVSPYYAGLNLIMLAVGLVLQWNLAQSVAASGLIILMYLAAALPSISGQFGIFFNNLWFLLLTGIIVVVGNHFQARLRQSDYMANHALEQSRKELEVTNQKLRELDEIKGRFFANVSHELRTPLTLLLGPLESLQANPALKEPRIQEHLQTMQANGMRLLKLINDLLELVRLDADQMRLKKSWLDVGSFTRGVISSVQSFAQDRGLKMELTVEPGLDKLLADPDKLEKVFLNLLFNAIKFTAAGKRIELRVRPDQQSVVFEVEDQGVGIAPEHVPYLFSRFWQADTSARRKYQGAGLGLALVKELVEAHSGTVTASSRVGIGTTMTVRLPIAATSSTASAKTAPQPSGETTAVAKTEGPSPDLHVSPAPSPPKTAPALGSLQEIEATASPMERQRAPSDTPEPQTAHASTTQETEEVESQPWLVNLYRRAEMFASLNPLRQSLRPWTPPSSKSRPRLVVADDEPDMLRFLKTQLEETYEVIEAVDGEQALTLTRQYIPDAVVCDMMLPEKDGLQVCRELAENQLTRSIPFLMVTARADDETKLQALGAGASDFVAKPFSLAELQVRIRNLVSNHQLQKAVLRQNHQLTATVEQLKDTELQLVQSEKMASLGRMSAGILHEINNPLNYTKTGLHILARFESRLPDASREEFHETIGDLNEGISRVVRIVTDLRAFSHPQGGEIQEVNVADVTESALRFLAAEWRDQITIVNEIPEEFLIQAERNRFLQIIVNLLQNSLDSLRSKTFTPPEAPTIRLRAWDEAGAQIVGVWDNGMGISESNLSKIFDPFFTTKDVGEGTGLGLSICYRMIQEWGGHIRVDTREGEFCEFRLEFFNQAPLESLSQSSSLIHS